jgi:type I restriction enzyme, R subunit
LSEQVRTIAGLLEERSAIPMVRAQLELIQEIQLDDWWQNVTVPMLETVRRRLRSLVKLIEKQARKPVYTDFEDELGEANSVELPGFATAESFEKFRDKARAFLRSHQDHLAIHKLRMNEPLTAMDLQELERMLAESGGLNPEHLAKAKQDNEGLGLFVRSLVGMEREAAKLALGAFAAGSALSANQIEFVNLIVDQLTACGAMSPELLYESPFTDLNPKGPDGVFDSAQVDELIRRISEVRARAIA